MELRSSVPPVVASARTAAPRSLWQEGLDGNPAKVFVPSRFAENFTSDETRVLGSGVNRKAGSIQSEVSSGRSGYRSEDLEHRTYASVLLMLQRYRLLAWPISRTT
jgi:hypothetical protein